MGNALLTSKCSLLELSVPRDEGFESWATLSAPSEAKEEAITEFLS
jgi:hypothetical protein